MRRSDASAYRRIVLNQSVAPELGFGETAVVSSFSRRHGYRRPLPERDIVEDAPEPVRAQLRRMMLDEWGALAAYRRMCEVLDEVPDSDVWSNQGAASYVDYKLGVWSGSRSSTCWRRSLRALTMTK
jgi:hypothetical protein